MRPAQVAACLLALQPLAALADEVREGFGPGEETVLEFRYLGVVAGEGRMAVGQGSGAIWPVVFQARTRGVVGMVDIREHLVSLWDSAKRLPLGSDQQAVELGDHHVERVRFDRLAGKAVLSTTRKGLLTTRTIEVAKDAQEITSALLWLRLQRLAPGDRYEVPIASGEQQFTMGAEVLGREEVDTPAGLFRCVKISVKTGLSGPFATDRASTIWLSDDPRHVFVRLSADFAVGSVVGTVTQYRPGVAPASAVALTDPPASAPPRTAAGDAAGAGAR
jgi:hypothetical protein